MKIDSPKFCVKNTNSFVIIQDFTSKLGIWFHLAERVHYVLGVTTNQAYKRTKQKYFTRKYTFSLVIVIFILAIKSPVNKQIFFLPPQIMDLLLDVFGTLIQKMILLFSH